MSENAFPDVRWGKEMPRLRNLVGTFAGSKYGSWAVRQLTPLDYRVLRRTKGRYTVLGPVGLPLLLLATTGRKSGKRRETPLLYLREGDRLYVTGSNFGQSKHPEWSTNLIADAKGWVTIGGQEIPVLATQLDGAEYDRVWDMFLEYANVYPSYVRRTDRHLRVFALAKR